MWQADIVLKSFALCLPFLGSGTYIPASENKTLERIAARISTCLERKSNFQMNLRRIEIQVAV
jgi:hypothetical protein